MKIIPAMLCAAALLSTNPALACGRAYSVGHAYTRATTKAIGKGHVSPRLAAPGSVATGQPAEIQSRAMAAPTLASDG
jgi:hypothetical protein